MKITSTPAEFEIMKQSAARQRNRGHRTAAVCFALAALVVATCARAYQIEATASSTLNAFFPSTTRDRQVSSALTAVSAAQSGPDPTFGHLESHASVSLAAGSVGAYAKVNNTNTEYLPGLVAEAGGTIDETLSFALLPGSPPVTIVLPPGAPLGAIPVTLVLHAHGAFSDLSGAGHAYGYFELGGTSNSISQDTYMTVDCSSGCSAVHVGSAADPNGPTVVTIDPTPGGWLADLSLSYLVDPALPFDLHVNMYAQASSYGAGSATLDAANTARIEVLLPQGYVFTSSSGVFLSGAPAPAGMPLPSTAWLMSSGLIALLVSPFRRCPRARPGGRNGHALG